MTRTERDHIEYLLARLEKSAAGVADAVAAFRQWLDGLPLPPAQLPLRPETQGDFDAPHQLAAEAQRLEEAEDLVHKYPRVRPGGFERLYHIAAEGEQIGQEHTAWQKRIEAIERGDD